LDLRKGILRIYIVATAVWLLFMLAVVLIGREPNTEGLIGLAVGVPAIAYLLLFVIIPWIWRGFQSR
jgi:hypothetical protein